MAAMTATTGLDTWADRRGAGDASLAGHTVDVPPDAAGMTADGMSRTRAR
ncbi:hypothetical protein [Streptomyces sp. NPDC057623]